MPKVSKSQSKKEEPKGGKDTTKDSMKKKGTKEITTKEVVAEVIAPTQKEDSSKKEKQEEKSAKQESKGVPERTGSIEAPSAPVVATPIVPKNLGLKKLSYFDRFGLSKDRDHFIENLSMLVLSGMPLVGALTSIVNEERNPRMKKILEGILAEIEGGSPLWKSFERTGMFRGYTISLIRIGEESGKFAENLKVVAEQEEKDREFRSKVKSALMYPVFVLTLTLVVGIGISWFILPKLAKIFFDLKLTLPLVTRILMGFGIFLSKNGLWAVPLGTTVLGGILYTVFGLKRTQFIGEAIIFSIPGIKTLMAEVELARFGYLLGTLLEAGLPVTKAIDSLEGASDVLRYKKFYAYLRDSIELGNSFQKSFTGYKKMEKLIPIPIQQLVISGEQSGNLTKTLIKVGQVLEAKSDQTTKNLTIIMEPILLVIVWAGVVSVAFAVILPIYSLVGDLNKF
jgi:type II secretory pathway component PulF